MQPSLFLIPVTLGETTIERVLPSYNKEIILQTKHFIVENIRTARRFLKKVDASIDIDELTFYELNKHTNLEQIETYLTPISKGFHIGIISEAGCPAIADPGSDIVAIAQRKNYNVIPLIGPSSILLSLMASGFNGQSFAFQGYLPVDSGERVKKIKQLEHRILNEDQTQIFIETPYRNLKIVEDLIKNCPSSLKLCIAMNITCEDEYIKTLPVKEWSKKLPDMAKKPCIFLLYK
ncbi:SAM-dependent methyltransferase [Dysgonomonas sp. ZJ709]|uniref:SAM-dependent methyltransferase n=1 Tax=Dysgonomonas sp. ZJ709 TaxID=2709797 RepID=UPI0013EAF5D7|nr:SAM-dependent methyltransferase [Dysgonomonas sp. ZJ709]